MNRDAWEFVGLVVTTLGVIAVALVGMRAGKPANEVAEARISAGGDSNGWMSLTQQYDALTYQLRAEMSALRTELCQLRDAVAKEREETRAEISEFRAYVTALVKAWGESEIPPPPGRVRWHLSDLFGPKERGL